MRWLRAVPAIALRSTNSTVGKIQVGAATICAKVAFGSKNTPVSLAKSHTGAGPSANAVGFSAIAAPPRTVYCANTSAGTQKYHRTVALSLTNSRNQAAGYDRVCIAGSSGTAA